MKTPYGYVYRISNKLNGKTYIGMRKLSLDRKWRDYLGSGRYIRHAISKYGKNNFIKSFISYAPDLSTLKAIEKDYINRELRKGGGQYNIVATEFESLDKKTFESLDRFPILHWYFEEKISTHKIAEKINYSQPVVLRYIRESGDARIALVKQGSSLGKREKEGTWKSIKQTKLCSVCNTTFLLKKKNQKVCSRLCAQKAPKTAAVGKPKTSAHKDNISLSMKGNKNGAGNSGGKITSHKRWHKDRGIFSESCELCLLEAHKIE